MAVSSPYHFRPMGDLTKVNYRVEIATATGAVVIGWLFVAGGERSFWTAVDKNPSDPSREQTSVRISAIGWREIEKDWTPYLKESA